MAFFRDTSDDDDRISPNISRDISARWADRSRKSMKSGSGTVRDKDGNLSYYRK
jgi:hypothetical protein